MREEVYRYISKLVSAIVVLNLAFGGLLGLMLIEDEGNVTADVTLPYTDEYNIVVNTYLQIDGSTLPDNTLDIDANITVTTGGTLDLVNCSLVFQSDINHRFWFRVEGGGDLLMDNSKITVETSEGTGALFENYEWVYWYNSTNNLARFKRMVPFDMTVTGAGSTLDMSKDSALKWEGELNIENDAYAMISNSVISSPSAPHSTYDWGIVVSIQDCSPLSSGYGVVFEESRIEKSPWFQGIQYVDPDDDGGNPSAKYLMYANHTITNSEVHIIDTYWDIDYQNRTSPALNTQLPINNNNNVNHYPWFINPNSNGLEILGTSKVNIYGLTIDMDETGGIIPTDGYTALDVIDASADVTLYRWLAVTPVDSNNISLDNVDVTITTIKGAPLSADVNALNAEAYCQPAWDYIRAKLTIHGTTIGPGLIGTTGSNGRVIFPLASDVLTQGGWPNSDQFPDGYNIDATSTSPVETVEGLVDFVNFPSLFPEDNFVDYIMPAFSFAAPHAELYPEWVVVPQATQLENVVVNFDIRVWNEIIGVGDDADNFWVQIWDGDPSLNTSTKIGEIEIASLPAGQNTTLSFTWTAAPPGAHTIYVGVDRAFDDPFVDNSIPEENEDDNVMTTTISVLERPDLFINGTFISFNPSNVVVNGTAVQINAQVQNIGGSTASNVIVNFYDGISTGSGAYIGSDTITVTPGSSTIASIGWGPDVGFHYVWVKIDELPLPGGVILEKDETNNVGSQSIEVKSRPDLNATIIFNPGSPQYEGTEITIQANVANSGGWNATKPIKVIFYKNDLETIIGEVTIPVDFTGVSIGPDGGSVTVSITWTAEYPPDSTTFFVKVDTDDLVDESDETNNVATNTFYVNPRPNLKITSTDITFSDAYPMEGENIIINMEIWNAGLSDVVDPFWVRVWLDEVGTGTMLYEYEETTSLPIAQGSSITPFYNWNGVTPYGKHNIIVTLDYNDQVAETDDTGDNQAAGTLVIFKVPSDLIVNDATNYPPYPQGTLMLEDYWDSDDPYIRDGYTLVEQSGELTIRNSIFKVVGQGEDYEFNIVVKDSGKLYIDEDSFITSEQYPVNIYLFDFAELHIEGSTLDTNININATDNAKIFITEQSAIYGDIIAEETGSSVNITIVNSTLSGKLENIGGGTHMELWGVYIAGEPASDKVITLSDGASANIDWFLKVKTVDVNVEAIEGANVYWYRSPPWTDSGSGMTDSDGFALFRLRGMNITATMVVEDIGSYKVMADFTSPYTLLDYYPDANVTFDLDRNKMKTIKFSEVMPDLDPPLFVTYPFSILSVGDTATIKSWVNNTGSGNATDVVVKFDDDTNEQGEPNRWPYTIVIDYISPGGSEYIQFDWIPSIVGFHNITIEVDPSNLIIEGDPYNNDNTTLVFVTPQKADLVVNVDDINFVYPSTGPTENDTISIQATIWNVGETNAFPPGKLTIEYWLGDSGGYGGGTFIGTRTIAGVSAGSSIIASYDWIPTPPKIYWIWVVVDPDARVEETREDNNNASKSIDIKTYADITPVGLDFLVDEIDVPTTPDTTEVTLRATVQNLGETDAQNVKVQFFKGDPSAGGIQIGSTQTILEILADTGSGPGDGQAEVIWIATVTGISEEHDIYVRVFGVNENILDNNEYTRNITVTLRPILTVVDIDFSDNSPFEGQNFKIFGVIKNIGGTAAPTFNIAFWDGDPEEGGNQIGADSLSLGIDETGEINVSWIPSTGGAYEVFVVVDSDNTVDEADETNNVASEVIVVYSKKTDLIVTTEGPDANSPYNIGYEFSPEPLAPQHRGYILVEADGILTMTYTTFTVLQSSDYKFNIIVRNNGTFILEKGSTLLTNGPLMRLYLYDNATLIIRDSTITSSIVDIMAFGNSKITIDESIVNSFIVANSPTANIMLDVTNSSLTQAFTYFGGTSQAIFTNVVTPSVELSAGAKLTVYQWLMAYVKDGAGTGIEGSEVKVTNKFDGSSVGLPKLTGEEGLALFEILTDNITATTESSWLNYFIEADYLYESLLYQGNTNVTFTSYLDDKENNMVEAIIYLGELKPNLVANGTLIKFYKDTTERFTVGIGEPIIIEATIKNVGTAGTTPLTQVLVRFHHKLSQTSSILLGEDIIDTPMEAQTGSGIASITWIPIDSEWGTAEQIWITVDPTDAIKELQEQDNSDYTTVNIVRPPDLEVSNIRFNTAELQNIDNTTESVEVTILVTISNLGTERQAQDLNVSFFSGFPDFDGDMKPDAVLPSGVELIGGAPIQLGNLAQGTPTTVSITWDTSNRQKGHSIYVYVTDSTDMTYIADQDLENNNATVSFVVFPKPDLEPKATPPQTEVITLTGTDGTVIGNPQIGQGVNLQAIIFNYGQVFIHAVDVSFWNGHPQSGGTQIGKNVTISIAPNSPMNASVPWTVAGPSGAEGDVDIYVWVNPSEDVIESDYSNNVVGTTFSVAFADVTLSFTFIPKSSYPADATIDVTGRFEFTDTKEGIPNLPYTLRIRRADNDQQYGTEVTGTLSPDGNMLREIAAPTAGGRYYLELTTTYGGTITSDPSATFEVEEEEQPFLPFEWIILIIIIAVLVVVLAGVALAKLGVGKLVECGECGAFIHEGEKKCPKCGAVFESDNAKCSECSSWIPVDSKSCPECGAIFAGLEKDKKDYIERMKGQYAEYVEQYRGEAREDLGTGMGDEEFSEWWKASPKYVGFEDWLAREEELKKGRTKPCPSCNTTNPESAAICFKCGTVFKKEEEAPPPMEKPPQRPPAEVPAKRVSRPPEQRREQPPTVVPKKVVKQPPEVVPKKVVKRPPTVVPKKVVKRPPPEE